VKYNFDQIIDRTHTNSTKWQKFPTDVLPMWVADMDFAAPDFVLRALRERLDHPIIGYTDRPKSLNIAFQQWLQHHFGWSVPDEWIVWLPGVVPALNLAARTLEANASLMIPTPVYHPFFDLAGHAGLQEIQVPMAVNGGRWEMDWDAMHDAIEPSTRMIMICNPQNPTGRSYTAAELSQLADFIERHDLTLVSDEIHCNLILDPESRHIPVAAAHPEIAARTISLYAATKTYNIAGISCAAAVVPDARLRQRLLNARAGLMPGIGPLGFVASEAGFNDRSDWIPQLLDYLRANLALVQDTLGDRLTPLEATYLAWIDVQDLDIADPLSYFAEYKLGLSVGAQFGQPGYLRLNFACPRQTLQTGLARLTEAIAAKR
jgi:cystathionine beta-lyase